MRWLEDGLLMGIGGTGYVVLECLWRGFSHPSMFVVGGLCFWLLSYVPEQWHWGMQMGASGLVIITMEFFSGCILNLWLGWNVWDYGVLWGNLWGQICVLYSMLWVGLSWPALWLNRQVRHGLKKI